MKVAKEEGTICQICEEPIKLYEPRVYLMDKTNGFKGYSHRRCVKVLEKLNEKRKL